MDGRGAHLITKSLTLFKSNRTVSLRAHTRHQAVGHGAAVARDLAALKRKTRQV